MEFNRETVADELNRSYSGVKITDGPNGPFELRSALRLGSTTSKLINAIASEMERHVKEVKAEEGGELDTELLTRLTVDGLALRSTSPADFREWLDGFPEDDVPAILRMLQKGLETADQGESAA